MRKRMIAMILCGVAIFSGRIQTLAADVTTEKPIIVSPQMEYISQESISLTIDNTGNAKVDCYVSGFCGITTSIEITAKLQRCVDGKWVTLKTFTTEKESFWISLKDSYKVSKGYTYRVRATVHAYSDSSSETRTVISNEVKY